MLARKAIKQSLSRSSLTALPSLMQTFRSAKNLSQRELAEKIARIPEIYEVCVISGEWDIVLKARAGSVEEIGLLVVDKLRVMEGIEKTETCIAFQMIKENF